MTSEENDILLLARWCAMEESKHLPSDDLSLVVDEMVKLIVHLITPTPGFEMTLLGIYPGCLDSLRNSSLPIELFVKFMPVKSSHRKVKETTSVSD